MKFNCDVKIVDMVMGSGKTTSCINYMNEHKKDKRFLYITPLSDEVNDRILVKCKNFYTPNERKFGTKLRGIKYLLENGYNIASTHALFHLFDSEIIDICKTMNYTLVMDEVTDVIEPYDITKDDVELLLKNYVYIDEETNLLKWRDDADDYHGKFENEKKLCDMNCLAYYSNSVMMWLFPIEIFNSFQDIYIMTYMFNSQIQRYYYDYYNLPYRYIYTTLKNGKYSFTENESEKIIKHIDYKSLIHICDNDKMNEIGDSNYDLSKSWYKRNANNVVMLQMQKNMKNWFNNIRKSKSKENIWTTFKDFKDCITGKGYSKSFIPSNSRATNKYGDRINIAYPINKFLHSSIKQFFLMHNVNIDENGYALSEMLQFIWRSAIRNDQEIWIYIPSIRMRNLLQNWIEEMSNV